MLKKSISVILVVVFLFSVFLVVPITVRADSLLGQCGYNAYCTLSDDGTLTISGTGNMYNCQYTGNRPWYNRRLEIKSIIIENGITSIGQQAFEGCQSLQNISIPDSVKSIGIYAFGYCKSLVDVKIPDSVTQINYCAFADCESLTCIVIPESITCIETQTFRGCKSLKSVTIPKSVKKIEEGAFKECYGLTGVYISDLAAWCNIDYDGIQHNGSPLYYAHNLYLNNELITDLVIPDTVKTISEQAFYHCRSIESVVIPNTVTGIDYYAFEGCTSLKSVSIPDSVMYIGKAAFLSCDKLTNVVIGNKVRLICNGAFNNCESLTSITIPDSVKEIEEGVFAGCKRLNSITIPDSVERLGRLVFSSCTNLKSVTIGKSVDYIPDYAFSGCVKLTSITIPVSVTSIGDYAFSSCRELRDVYYSGTREDWDKIGMLDGCNIPLLNATIHYNSIGSDSYRHVINSDNDNKHLFYFNENEEIEDLLASMPSVQYNPRLSHFLACMARSAYTPDLAKYNYAELGFTVPEEQHCDSGDPIAGFYVGEKKLDNGKKIVMVTIRGSDDWSEWLQTNFNIGNSAMLASAGFHSGFYASAQKVFEYLANHYGDTESDEITYVITGHSLGAAVGNILAKFLDYSGIPTSYLYAYNFACPNIGIGSDDISIWNENGKHNNIINVGNWCDEVSHEPGLGVEFVSVANRLLCGLNGWHKWKRFGVSYWFYNGYQFPNDAHDMGVYLDYLEKEYDETHFVQKEYEVKAISVHCPVDAVVYDSNGNPIAGTINNEPNYYGYEPGEKALIFIDGDRKLFHVFNNEAYEVKLIGTDVGEMEYGVSTGDMTSGDVYSEKWFEGVALETGKEMIGKNVNVLDEDTKTITQDEKLLLVDGQGGMNTQILENGEETDYSIKYILGDADGDGDVASIDATYLLRFNADMNIAIGEDVLLNGDADGNGELEIIDATYIQRWLAEFSVPYLIGVEVV